MSKETRGKRSGEKLGSSRTMDSQTTNRMLTLAEQASLLQDKRDALDWLAKVQGRRVRRTSDLGGALS